MISPRTAYALAEHSRTIERLNEFKRQLDSRAGELVFVRPSSISDTKESVRVSNSTLRAAIEAELFGARESLSKAESAAITEFGVERVGQMEAALNSAIRECEHWATHHLEKGSVEKHNYWQEKAMEYREALRSTPPASEPTPA